MLRFISAENQVEQVFLKGRPFAVTLKRAVVGNWNIFPEKKKHVSCTTVLMEVALGRGRRLTR